MFCDGFFAARAWVRCMLFMCVFLLFGGVVSAQEVEAENPSAVILMYHRFGDKRYPSTNIRMDQLKAQVAYLSENGFSILPLQTVVEAIRDKKELPEKSVAITVDDAFASVYENGYPVFKEKGWPFTVFVCSEPVDQKRKDYMTWDQMREMKANGVTFANHGARHDHLIDRLEGEDEEAWLARVREIMVKGKARVDEELRDSLPYLAYPYGEYNEPVGNLAASLGFVAFGQHSGAFGVTSDFRRIPRFPMSEIYGKMPGFKTKVKSLPLPIVSLSPWDPVTTSRRPVLEVTLGDTKGMFLDELACYVGGQGRVEVQWVEPGKRFRVEPSKDLPNGRSKVNITIPTQGRKRYVWFSRQWVVQGAP